MVLLGPTLAFGRAVVLDPDTSHWVDIGGLACGTLYHLAIVHETDGIGSELAETIAVHTASCVS